MTLPPQPPQNPDSNAFTQAASQKGKGLVGEFVEFALSNKKWWLIPLVMALAIVGLLVFLSTTPAAPFIYTLF